MSTKLPTSKASVVKACEQLQSIPIYSELVRRCNILDKLQRTGITKKMKDSLASVAELQSKYIELPEFKRHCCTDIDKVLPLGKTTT